VNGLYSVGVKDAPKVRRGPAKPKPAKGSKSETSLHWHVAGLLTTHLAEPAWFTTFPAGGGGEMRGKILKGLGLKSGVPDILIINPVTALLDDGSRVWVTLQLLHWIELKKLKSGTISEAQISTQGQLVRMGCRVANCDNLEDVKRALREWALPYQAMTPTEAGIQTSLRNSFANV
jgi:hypothetical protein